MEKKKGETNTTMCCGDVDKFPPNKLVWRKVWGWYDLRCINSILFYFLNKCISFRKYKLEYFIEKC